ncbi:hypothetical protein NL676_030484 [Syzygium grande]|nr:hypothetical protein NL676_030484 [Syzygium grande]
MAIVINGSDKFSLPPSPVLLRGISTCSSDSVDRSMVPESESNRSAASLERGARSLEIHARTEQDLSRLCRRDVRGNGKTAKSRPSQAMELLGELDADE